MCGPSISSTSISIRTSIIMDSGCNRFRVSASTGLQIQQKLIPRTGLLENPGRSLAAQTPLTSCCWSRWTWRTRSWKSLRPRNGGGVTQGSRGAPPIPRVVANKCRMSVDWCRVTLLRAGIARSAVCARLGGCELEKLQRGWVASRGVVLRPRRAACLLGRSALCGRSQTWERGRHRLLRGARRALASQPAAPPRATRWTGDARAACTHGVGPRAPRGGCASRRAIVEREATEDPPTWGHRCCGSWDVGRAGVASLPSQPPPRS